MFNGSSIQCVLPLFLSLIAFSVCPAQNILQNSSLEVGTNTVASWGITGSGSWSTISRTGARSVALAPATGMFATLYSGTPIAPNRAYIARFWTRATNAVTGYCIGGFNIVTRDFPKPADYWQEFSMAAWVPPGASPYFKCETWNMDGTAYFDDCEVLPLNAINQQVGPYQLGAGETLEQGHYRFRATYSGYGGNFSRALQTANTTFNSVRWVMNTNAQVVYRHSLEGVTFSNVQVECGIENSSGLTGNVLSIEASTNGTTWQFVSSMAATVTNGSVSLPANLLPSPVMFIRLSSTNFSSGNFGLSNYVFRADIPDTSTTGVGETHYFGDFMTNSTVRIAAAETTPAGHLVTLAIPNLAASNRVFQVLANTSYSTNTRSRIVNVAVPAGSTNQVSILLPSAGFGNNTCLLTVKDNVGTNVFQQNVTLKVSILSDDSYGEALPAPDYAPLWWCDGGYKVGQTRSLPLATNTAIHIAAARNEYEPFQLVLRPSVALSNVTATIGNFVSLTNLHVIPATHVTISRVEYVNVTQLMPGESYSVTGEHPDPLIPLTGPFDAPAQTNTVLWFTVHVPKRVTSGDYQAAITITSSAGTFTVPVRLRVFGFSLTDVTHTPTSYGAILQYAWHGLSNSVPGQEQAIWELYMANMARHRITPYFPQWYSQIEWNFNQLDRTFKPSYTNFDGPMERYLEDYNFTSFKDVNVYSQLPPIPTVPALIGTDINPEYRPLYTRLMRPIMQHLREKGWANRTYSYWLDEPDPSKYALLRDGMQMIEEAVPDIKRCVAITSGVEPSLIGYIDRWSPLMPSIKTNVTVARQLAGDEVWSYVAVVPRAPWPNNFIDHPAINPRARAWLAERMGITGELYYGINHYLGTTNVWKNPMSSTDQTKPNDYLWGNGDGTLVYPPTMEKPQAPLIAGPFDSVRWEMIRDAQEDREYFWSLKRLLSLWEPVLGTNHPAIIEARAARAAAMSLVSLAPADHYPYEPARFYNTRLRLGSAIEALEDGAPFVAKQPLSKTALVGSTETLRVEASGWPVPSIQWQHAGTNLPGEITDKLVLSNLNVSLAGDYTAILGNSMGVVTSAVGRVTLYDDASAPVVVAQSTGSIHTNGARVIFWVGASSVTPLTYQWMLEGVPLAGATNMTLVLTNVSSTDVGYYSVLIQNSVGTITNTPASLYVVTPGSNTVPLITAQPLSQVRFPGQAVQLSASVVGITPISYQWYFNTNILVGETASTLFFPSVHAAQFGTYTLRATNFAGAVTSAPALLQVATMPRYTNEQPAYAIARSGTGFQLTLAPDNRTRTVLTSTNLRDWTIFFTAAPSVMPLMIPAGTNDEVQRFFRLQADAQFPPMPSYTSQPPGISGTWVGSDYILNIEPDNRQRTVFTSTNLLDWTLLYMPSPSALPEAIPTSSGDSPRRFFRLLANP